MAHLNLIDGLLAISCEFDQRGIAKGIGGRWNSFDKTWDVAFTLDNLENVIDAFGDDLYIDDDVEKQIEIQKNKEARLRQLKKLANEDASVKLRVPGLRLIDEEGNTKPVSLYNYQKLGVSFCATNGEGVLLADACGLGKTIQAISVSLMLKQKGLAESALIVTPASLKWNWPLEIEKFTNEKYVVIDDKSPDKRVAQWLRKDVFFYIVNYELLLEDLFGGRTMKNPTEGLDETPEQKQKRLKKIEANKKRERDVKRRQRLLQPIRKKKFGIVVLDEAHAIKNHKSNRTRNVKALKSHFRLALTGTPMDGRLEELHSIMDFVMPGLLGSKTSFMQNHADCDKWGKVIGYRGIQEVKDKIDLYFLRRLKENVLKDLPPKIYQNRVITLSPTEKKIYRSLADGAHEITEDAEAMVCIMRCRQFCEHPSLLEEKCKGSKHEALRDVLQELVVDNGRKAIVFSQFKTVLNILVKLFDDMGLSYLRIDGDTDKKERAVMQEQFNSDASIDLMVGTEAMSTGLNFTGADVVINYSDNWSPALMAQREDRSCRIGQKNTVQVINFICKDTIEERIRGVISSKNTISNEVLGDNLDEAIIKRMNPKEIAKLL